MVKSFEKYIGRKASLIDIDESKKYVGEIRMTQSERPFYGTFGATIRVNHYSLHTDDGRVIDISAGRINVEVGGSNLVLKLKPKSPFR